MKQFLKKKNKLLMIIDKTEVGFIEFKVDLKKNEITLLETYIKEMYKGKGYGEELYREICKKYKNLKINIKCSYLRKKEENRNM